MSKSHLIAALMLSLAPSVSFGAFIEGWERPILRSEMKILDSRGMYDRAESVELTLTRRDGSSERAPTGITLTVKMAANAAEGIVATMENTQLEIVGTEDDGCGSKVYHAQVPGQNGIHGARLNVTLTDHSARTCENVVPFLWEAHVRRGFGWCGTMDDTLSLGGQPEPVYTILSRERSIAE
ncbi:MAG: hypothetical protein IT285_14075 [Bdellovibrionales bacterium]|nr:hypothetical protein [Bdellovibrionales bacterium]